MLSSTARRVGRKQSAHLAMLESRIGLQAATVEKLSLQGHETRDALRFLEAMKAELRFFRKLQHPTC